MSPVLKITLEGSDQETTIPVRSTLVLKVFDSQRESKTHEEGDAKRIELEDQDQELLPLEKEAYLDTLLQSYYTPKVKVYGKLSDLQGRGIPKFYGQTQFAVDSSSHPFREADMSGILLEYIEGRKLAEFTPELFHESIATSALDIVFTLEDKEILNEDVRLENFVVPSSGTGRPAVMIDFAQCVFREEESDKE